MKEYTITIDIDEEAGIKAETKGTVGDICVTELEEVLKGLEGEIGFKNKPEFYKKQNINMNRLTNKNN